MLLRCYYDLHIHSCLSPCADPDMTPFNIAQMAALAGYQMIAVADHNSTGNCRSVIKAASAAGILAVPAMELTTAEEVHVLCLLPDADAADAFGRYVRERLPERKNVSEFFGDQLLMDDDDTVLGREEILLSNATTIRFGETPALLRAYGGVAVPAHMDRGSFSVISNLGFLDRDLGFPAVEITRTCELQSFLASHGEVVGLPYMINSDAHDLSAMPEPKHKIDMSHLTAVEVIRSVSGGKLTSFFSRFG